MAVLALVAIVLLWPTESIVVAPWTVTVVDEQGRPVPNAAVNCSWRDYSLESEDHEERTHTDAAGKVSFPERRIRASRLRRVLGPALNAVREGVHASFGPSGQLVVYGVGGFKTGGAIYHRGVGPPSIVVLRKDE